MPVEKRQPSKPPDIQSLTEDLKREWTLGEASPNGEPRIILEESSARGPLHIYVVWGAWASLPQTTRSEIIMDAAEAMLSPEDMVRITLAMGVASDKELW